MATFGDATPSALDYAVDSTAMNGGAESSIWEDASNLASKGLPLVARSVYLSFKNMPADVGNWFGQDNHLETMEENIGPQDADLQAYYQAHSQGVNAAGIIAGSFIPGGAAAKVLSAGKIVSAIKAGKTVEDISRATSLLPSVQRANMLSAASAEIRANVTVYSAITADTLKAAALGVADQALQAAAWETATIATMHSNPALQEDGFADSVSHVFWGGVTGGLFASPFMYLGSRNTLRAVQQQEEFKTLAQRVVTKQGGGNFIPGDTLAQTLHDVWNMEGMQPGVSLAGKTEQASRAEVVRLDAIQKLNAVSDDPAVSNSLFDFLYAAKARGVPLFGESDQLGVLDYLSQARGVHRVNNPDFLTNDPDAFFLNVHNKNTAGPIDQPNHFSSTFDATAASSRRVKFADGFDQTSLRIAAAGDPASADIVAAGDKLAPSAADAWKWGYHLWIDPLQKLHINPDVIGPNGSVFKELGADTQLSGNAFKLFKQTGKLPTELSHLKTGSVALNVKTGNVSNDVWPTVGDVASAKFADAEKTKLAADSPVKLVNGGNSLEVEGTVYDHGAKAYDVHTASNFEANSRYAWAWLRGFKKGDVIDAGDLPRLEAAVYKLQSYQPDEIEKLGLAIKMADGSKMAFPADANSLQGMVMNLKQSLLRDLLADTAAARDTADIATRVNAPIDWVQGAGQTTDFSTASINPADHFGISHVRVNYDVNPTAFDADANVARGVQAVQYRIDAGRQLATTVSADFFREAADDIIIQNTREYNSAAATTQKTSSTAFGRASGDLGSLASRLQLSAGVLTERISKAVQSSIDQLTPYIHSLRSTPTDAASLAALRNAHLRMGEKFAFLPTDSPALLQKAEAMLGRKLEAGEAVLVPRQSLGVDPKTKSLTWNHDYKPRMTENPTDAKAWVTASEIAKQGGAANLPERAALGMYTVPAKVAAFLRAQQGINDSRLIQQNNFYAATGNARRLETGNVYFPPVNTRNYPFVAFVKQRDGLGGGTASTSAVLGKDAADLQKKIELIKDAHPELEIYTKGQTADYFKARGDYDYNMNLTDNDVNTSLHRSGVLADHVPNMNADTTLADYAEWNKNQITRLHRNYAELANGQLYAELELMGKQYQWLAQSRLGKDSAKVAAMTADNPYQNLRYQGLGINPRVDYTIWNDAQDKVESLFSTAFNKARESFGSAAKGLIPFEEANKICRQYGLGDPFGTTVNALRNYQVAGAPANTPMLERFIRTANSVQVATAIRLDAMQGLINAISTPILMWPEALDMAKKLAVTELPGAAGADGSPVNVLTLSKLLFQSVRNWHSTDEGMVQFKQALFDKGLLTTKPSSYFDLLDSMTLYGNETAAKLAEKTSAMVERGSNLIGTNFSEQFGRYMAADVARQIAMAGGKSGEDLWSMINTFVTRVHGARIAAQRPVAFQGPIGAAVGLFQTYQFNFMQNVFRHVGEGNYKALALLAGLQTTLYGMQGLPGFNFINQTIIGNAMNNPAHSDIYSGTKSLLGSSLGDWVLYGSASNILQSGIYTRGDVNPRTLTILPVNPADIPTVSSGIRAVSNVWQMAQKMTNGATFWDTFLQGMEHNGLSRPVSGMAQIAQGFSTTSQGSLIAANRPTDLTGMLDFFNISNAMRLTGARPIDEAVIMDAAYRHTAYQAADTARMQILGDAVKTSIRKGVQPSDADMEGFVRKYVAAGGYAANFGKAMIDWTKDADTSVANGVYLKLQTPAILNQQMVMGGKMLPDYTSAPTMTQIQTASSANAVRNAPELPASLTGSQQQQQ